MNQTRERIVETSAVLFRRQGYAATGLKQIAAEAKAPFGSIYHFFPGGKEQLGAEVIRVSGAQYGRFIDEVFATTEDPATAVALFFTSAADMLEASGYADACPVATVAAEIASTSELMRDAANHVFESWIVNTRDHLKRAGLSETVARGLAVVMLATFEGALTLSRTARGLTPMRLASEAVGAMVAAALAGGQLARPELAAPAR